MKAATVGEDGVVIADIDVPQPKLNEVLVKVRACGLNRADLMVASGLAHGRAGGVGTVIGLEWSGEVIVVGAEVQGLAPGDRVMCSGNSGWAEYAVTDWARAAKIPANNMTFEQAATLPVALQTMHDAIVTNGRFKSGQTALIQGASSGAGLMGLQVARAMGAKLVIGTSGNAERRARLSEFGADLAIDSSDESWVHQVLEATDGKGVDVTVDMLSGDFVNRNMQVTAVHGHVINIGRLAGMSTQFDCDLHAARRLHYIGTTGRSRSMDEHEAVRRKANEDLWGAVVHGEIASPIDKVFPLADAATALARMNANEHFGKIILQVQ